MNQNDQNPRHAHSQLRAIHAALQYILAKTVPTRPADQLLAGYLRGHREYGSRDRRVISEVVFGVFRWWGWLNVLAPPSVMAVFNRRSSAPDSENADRPQDESAKAWGPFVLAALLLENAGSEDLMRFLAEECGIEPEAWESVVAHEEADERFSALLACLPDAPGAGDLSWEALAPSWIADEIACPRPVPELIRKLQDRPPLWLRIQRGTTEEISQELATANIRGRVHPRLTDAISLGHRHLNLHELPAYCKGRVEIQDIASQAVGLACDPQPGDSWWDACCGGGGKSLHLARLLKGGGKGTILATDVRTARLRELRRRSELTGSKGIIIRRWDGIQCPVEDAVFDGVLVDAPCSGSGTWARNPWSRWLLPPEVVADQADRQVEILKNVAPRVAPGGKLVYSTCSFFSRENSGVCERFLAEHSDFALAPFAHPFTGKPTDGTLQIWPWDADCNSMFIARFQRANEA